MTFAVDANADEFLGEPLFIQPQKLWESRGGWGGTVTAHDGTIIVFRSPGGGEIRRSHDGGQTWEASEVIDPSGDPRKANIANALVDETTGDLLYICPQEKWLYRSVDSGETWAKEPITVKPDRLGLRPGHEGAGAMQAGITLGFGPHRGRLISPARIMGPQNSNDVHWRPYHYSTAIFSDDHGKSWQTSEPFPVLGTGEAAIAQLATGVLLLNSREHMSRGNRFIARSDDGGQLWVAPCRSADLPDGPRGSSYGLMGGMLRLPIAGRDILLFSNADTDLGAMPAQPGASISGGREKLTIWASFDGGQTWPTKRLLYDG
ncbi:MAG: exo-alpha-sialidase, partial [Planctomycetia bacterium]|nr:exo-alpha-sialidase [Planctomycetia bacterium]